MPDQPLKAMIFAAGLGTRLKPITESCPKALVEVNGKSLLQRNIEYLKSYGYTDIVINVHHFADQVEKFLSSDDDLDCNISISDERDMLLETGGGLKKASWFFEKNEEPFLVINVDILTDLDLYAFREFHLKNKPLVSLAVSKRESSRYFLFDEKMKLSGWENTKTGEVKISRGFGNALDPFAFSGVHMISGKIFDYMEDWNGKFSITDFYLHLAKNQKILGFNHTGDKFIDVGKPASIESAETLFD